MAGRIKSMTSMTQEETKDKQTGSIKPISVLLTADQLDHLKKIGKELGMNRHSLLRLIIADFIYRWLAGERPRTKTITTKTTVLDI